MSGEVKAAAQRFFASLSPEERWELGDQLVLGIFDWRDWFEVPPPRGFLAAIESERIVWEQTQ